MAIYRSSCIRATALLHALEHDAATPMHRRLAPSAGDLVLVRVRGSHGAYLEMETPDGRDVPLREGDILTGVFGNRDSSRNVSGHIPESCGPGDELGLLAVGGVVGIPDHVPRGLGEALQLEVVGFPSLAAGAPVNIRAFQHFTPVQDEGPARGIVWVAGTAAECGKTTLICELLKHIHQQSPGLRLAAIKVCGTGRLKDRRRYSEAGADLAADFVDAGFATTYQLPEGKYEALLAELCGAAIRVSDVVLAEIGGDLLSAEAGVALEIAAANGDNVIGCVNDPVGALGVIEILAAQGCRLLALAALDLNASSTSRRIGSSVLDIRDPVSVSSLAGTILSSSR